MSPGLILVDALALAILLVIACFDLRAAVIAYLALGIITKLAQAFNAFFGPIVEALKRART